MDKLLKHIDSPFLGNSSLGEEIINLFTLMHNGNSEMVKNIVSALPGDSLAILRKYVDL